MVKTVEAVTDETGALYFVQPVALPPMHRVLVIVLDDEPEPSILETAMMSEPALAVEWSTPEEDAAWSHLAQLPSL